jgi:ATP-dependent helicase/nuclease subunit A
MSRLARGLEGGTGTLPGDHLERRKAIESRKNLAVMAGAGTGKTTLLVDKIVRKVVDEGLPIERILALTFTEKAANDLRKRVRDALVERGRSDRIDRAEIGTIHGFCAHVLRQFPVEAGVRPDFQADEGTAFRRMFEERWPRWLDRELGPGAHRPRPWKDVLGEVDLRDLRELAEALASLSFPPSRRDGAETLREFAGRAAGGDPELAAAISGRGLPAKKLKKAGPEAASAVRLAEDRLRVDDARVGLAVELVSDFAAEFRAALLAEGWVSFEEMLGKVHELLLSREFPNVLELLRSKYEVLLVDEFQDTDPLQGEIIQRLAEGPDGKLVPGKLFIVGDPKQSIYSFRGADIIAYKKVVDRIVAEGGETVVLSTNFRSHEEILGFVNAVFPDVIRERGDLQPPYEPIHPYEGRTAELEGPRLEAVLVEEAKAGESRETEGEAVAAWIAAHREIAYGKIAILFKALTDLAPYIEALRAAGIPYVVQGEKLFYGTTEVIDFVNLLRAVENPHDRIAVASVLRSPLGAMTDQELYRRKKSLDYRGESDLAIFGFLREWHEAAGRTGVGELIDRIFHESYALEVAQAGYHGEQAVANLLKLRQKAAELEAHGGCTLREFLQAARRAVSELEEEGESPLADETLDAVTILSIHRSKGLEWPVVILPDLHRQSQPRDERAVRVDWPTRTVGVRLGEKCDSGGAALAWLDRERRREEEKRLLYVAVTRARERLLFLGSQKAPASSYLPLLLPELQKRATLRRVTHRPPAFGRPPAAAAKEKPDWSSFAALWREREKRAAVLEPVTSPTRLEGGEETAVERAVDVGSACHAVLERLDFRAPAVPKGTDPEAREILEGFFRSDAFRELAESEILARELPFVIRRDGRLVQGAIDVVYRRGGKVYVADYKTDRMERPEEYAVTREIYFEAVRVALGVEPRFKLIFLRTGRGVEP